MLETKTCLICDAPLLLHQRLTNGLCGKESCRQKLATADKSRLCSVCGRPLTALQLPIGACATPECQRIALGRKRFEKDKLDLALLVDRATKLRDLGAARFAISEAADFGIALVPYNPTALTELPEERRMDFREHVRQTIAEWTASRNAVASADTHAAETSIDASDPAQFDLTSELQPPALPAEPKPVQPGLENLLLGACTTCKGYCCRNGSHLAYLSKATFDRYFAAHPDCDADKALEDYTSRLPAVTYDQSCVFHTATGCALPTSMRSDICNEFFCEELDGFVHEIRHDPVARGFVVAKIGDRFQASAFVDRQTRCELPDELSQLSNPPMPGI